MIRRLTAISLRALGWAVLGVMATIAVAWWPNRSVFDDSVVCVDAVVRGPYLYRVDSLISARGCRATWDVLWDVTEVSTDASSLEQVRQTALQEALRRPRFQETCGFGRTARQGVAVSSPYLPFRFGRFARDPAPRGEKPIAADFAGTDHGAGWPCIAFWFNADESSSAEGLSLSRDAFRVSRGVPIFGGWTLALAPVWTGLLVNTALFGAVFFSTRQLSSLTIRSIRARARNRRHLCPRCAYDLRGLNSPTCPECGTACAIPTTTAASASS